MVTKKCHIYAACGVLQTPININVYEENETWNADVSVDVKERHYQETFYGIENNTIEFRVE